MKKIVYMLLVATAFLVVAPAEATVTFYTDRASFEAALSSYSVVDFEGIAPDLLYTSYNTSMTDVDFSGGDLFVAGANATSVSGPYDSAILSVNYAVNTIVGDLAAAGSGFTAVGGRFGGLYGDLQTTLTLMGPTGVLDTQVVTAGDIGAGSAETFYGWTVQGDEITSVSHVSDGHEVLDDLTYGYAVPEPATLSLLALGGLLLRKRK